MIHEKMDGDGRETVVNDINGVAVPLQPSRAPENFMQSCDIVNIPLGNVRIPKSFGQHRVVYRTGSKYLLLDLRLLVDGNADYTGNQFR